MFSITKLSQASQAFLSEMTINNKSRALHSSLAAAKVLTCKVILPSSAVEDITAFYRTHVQLDIETKLNSMNEILVLDTKTILDFCLKFYQLRYQSANPQCHVFSFNKDSAVEDFFGISRCFDKATIDSIKEDPTALAGFVNKYKTMLEEICVECKETPEGVV